MAAFSAIQPFSHSLTSTSPGHLANQETSIQVSLGKLFHSRFVCSQHTAPRNIKLAQTPPYLGTNSHLGLTQVEPQRFISCAQRSSHQVSVGFESGTSRSSVKHATTKPTCPNMCYHLPYSHQLSLYLTQIFDIIQENIFLSPRPRAGYLQCMQHCFTDSTKFVKIMDLGSILIHNLLFN